MENSPIWMIFTSILPPISIAVWTVFQWFANRKDKEEDEDKKDEFKREERLSRERTELSEAHTLLIKQLTSDIDHYRKIIEEKNSERWYAWDRARFWHQKAWDMRNEAAYARQIVESTNRLSGNPQRIWEASLELPQFDAQSVNNPPKQTA